MSEIDALLIAPLVSGGEGVYVESLLTHGPTEVSYDVSDFFGRSLPGARCSRTHEILLNRLLRPLTIPDMGFRAIKLDGRHDLIHVHAHPVHLKGLGSRPLVMSEGSCSAVYLGEYLGWSPERLARAYRRTRRAYRRLHISDRLLAMERASRVYVFSRWARDVNIRWGADPAKLTVIYPGFETPEAVDRRHRGTFTLLFVGTDFERKGGFDVVEAFATVCREAPRARLMLVGSDPSASNPDRAIHGWVGSERRARVLRLLADLEWRGLARAVPLIDRARLIEEVYPAADAFVMPTLAEGLGFTNIEAMSHGLPVISSRIGPVKEVVADGETGLLVPPGDVAALADAMRELLLDGERAAGLGAAGRRHFVQSFTHVHFRDAVRAMYRAVLRS